MTVTIRAAGPQIQMFALNLSDIEQPCDVVDAIVVSEMKDRLSPKNAPPTIRPVSIAKDSPDCSASPEAIGTSATTVPTLVPIDIEMKQDARNSPASNHFPGRTVSVRLTVASTLPIAFAVVANAPAITNIQIISRTFLLPAPLENMFILSATAPFVISIA